MELADLPLHHTLPEDLQKAFGHFKGEGHKAGAKSGGQHHGSVHSKLLQKIFPGFCQSTGFIAALSHIAERNTFLY